MTIKQWQPNIKIAIIGAVDIAASSVKGKTTELPPFRDGGITKVEIRGDDGIIRNVAIGRIKAGLYV